MTCPACQAAETGDGYIYRKGCSGCTARQIARGPVFFHRNDSEDHAKAYRALLVAAQLSPASVMRASQADKERMAACLP